MDKLVGLQAIAYPLQQWSIWYIQQVFVTHNCMSIAMHSIGQNIKSRKRPSVRPSIRPASVGKNVTSLMDRSSPNSEHSFPVPYTKIVFWTVRSEVVCAHARPLMGSMGWHLQVSNRPMFEAGGLKWLQLTSYRKSHLASPMVKWPMTSRDPKRSRSSNIDRFQQFSHLILIIMRPSYRSHHASSPIVCLTVCLSPLSSGPTALDRRCFCHFIQRCFNVDHSTSKCRNDTSLLTLLHT